jgi:hypothetical protein
LREYLFRADFRTDDGYRFVLDQEKGRWTDGDLSFGIDEKGFPVNAEGERVEGEIMYPLWFHLFIPFFAIQFYLRGFREYVRFRYYVWKARRSNDRGDIVATVNHVEKALTILNRNNS